MRLVLNQTEQCHLNVIRDLIAHSDTIYISVAFMKSTGLDLLMDNLRCTLENGCKCTFFAGTNFYLTDPKALRAIHDLFGEYPDCNLFTFGHSSGNMFHPKAYCFVTKSKMTLLSGSANFTHGGLVGNVEVSTLIETDLTSGFAQSVLSMFQEFQKSDNVESASLLSISQYEASHKMFRKKVDRAQKEAESEIGSVSKLDLSKMETYLMEYEIEEEKGFKDRQESYPKAKKILDQLAAKKISTKKEFLDLYGDLVGIKGKKRYWWSGGLSRGAYKAAVNFEVIIQLIRAVRENMGKPPKEVFGLGLSYIRRVPKFGVNGLTEIMHTYDDSEYAVLNNNSKTSLVFISRAEFPRPGGFAENDYERFVDLLQEVKTKCKFKSLGQVDHFLNYVYQNYAKK